MMNDQLPKNIDDKKDFQKYLDQFDCFYTMSDFMEEYRISKSTAKKLLEDIDHLGITQSLYTRLNKEFGSIDHKKFYNSHTVFTSLVEAGRISFNFNYMPTEKTESGQHEPIYTEVVKEPIPVEVIRAFEPYFKDISITSGTVPEMGKLFDETSSTDRKRNNRGVKKMEGIEICIGTGIKRYHPLIPEMLPLDAMVGYVLMNEIQKHKMTGVFCLLE